MKRIALVVVISLLAWGAYTLWVALDGKRGHDEMAFLMSAIYSYQGEVEKALRSGASIPAPKALPRQARAMSARPDGTILVEVSDDLDPGARLTLRPEAVPNVGYSWTCRAEKLRYVPAACR
jgi:hypothetical protein